MSLSAKITSDESSPVSRSPQEKEKHMADEKKAPATASKPDAKARLQKAFNEAVIGRIGDDRHHGWGAADSAEVIEVVIMEDVAIFREDKGNADKVYGPSEAAMSLIGDVINPSAFRQKLESAKRPDGQTVLQKSETKEREKRTLALYS